MKLLERKYLKLVKESDIPLSFFSLPVLRYFYLKRFEMVLSLMRGQTIPALLEIGYGNGILIPELASRTRELHGVDIKDNVAVVSGILSEIGLAAHLTVGDIMKLPYPDSSFDGIVYISILDHIKDLDRAMVELCRILRPGGVLYVGYPAKNAHMNAFFTLMGFKPDEIHPSSHTQIAESLARHFTVQESSIMFPAMPLYFASSWKKKAAV